jgi:hypothetical protein
MSLPALLGLVRERPEMYLQKVEFYVASAFIDGFNFANENGLLIGFREWLVTKLGYGNNLGWEGLVLGLAFPDADDVRRELEKEGNHERAVEFTFRTIEEFLHERQSRDGLRRIFLRYEEWLRRQDWYDPSSPNWVPFESGGSRSLD